MRSALRGPAHQLAVPVRMRINIHDRPIIIIAQTTSHAPATALAPRVCTLVPFIMIIDYSQTQCYVQQRSVRVSGNEL